MASKIITNYLPELSTVIFGRSKPGMVTVNLTNRCDQRCIYCEIGQGIELPKKDILNTDDLKWIIDQMSLNKIHKISLCGGEPFLFHGIIDVVAFAASRNVRCSITTNGMTAHKLTDNELDVLKNSKTEINVSIDSFNEAIQSFTRGAATALSNSLKSIQKLNEKQIPVTVLTAISRYNYHDLYGFLTQACEKGIRQVLFQPLIYTTNYPGQKPVDQKYQLNVPADQLHILMKELRKILKYEHNHPVKTNVYRILPWIEHYLAAASIQNGHRFFHDVVKKFYCREIDAIIDISFDGGFQPCGLAPATIDIFENRQLGLIALWRSATSDLKAQLEKEEFPLICNSCCHHFSRNMISSVMKYPVQNRAALMTLLPLIGSRFLNGIKKKIIFGKI
jgi:MoaA/NifB/PqqE/SkfB family radical SAM enzyme